MVTRPTQPRVPLSRRALLSAAAGAAAVAAVPSAAFADPAPGGPGVAPSEFPPLPPIAPLPAGAPVRTMFSPAEQRFAGYLAILPAMTNDIDDTNPDTYGWFRGGWWRDPSGPTNARVQEHVFTLSWFYANQRPWNPYHLDPALAGRLDAAIGHYLRLQHEDGSWPEYSITEHGLAPTGFALGYLAKTLANLRQVDALPQRRTEIETALRAGMNWLLDPANTIWNTPVMWSNQVTAGLAGSARAMHLIPDLALIGKLLNRIEFMAQHGQSPAGFFYDPLGMDINYNFEVMLPELAEVFIRTAHPATLSMARKFADWFGHNLLREPDGSGWLTYYAVSARTSTAFYDNVVPDPDRTTLGATFTPLVPTLAPFYTSKSDRAATRVAWAALPGPAPALVKQDTSPRIITHATYPEILPSTAVKEAMTAQVPYLRQNDFAEIRRDVLTNQDFLYARRPGYYVGAFFGQRATPMVRAGTGFWWHPQAGTVIHAQQTNTGCWATVPPGGNPDANGDLVAEYLIGDQAWDGQRAVAGDAPVRVLYHTADSSVSTELTLAPNMLTRAVRATTAATEQIPFVLLPDDVVSFTDGTPAPYNQAVSTTADGITIRRGPTVITVGWGGARPVTLSTSTRTYLRDARRRIHVLRIPHAGSIDVTVSAG
ncbi:MAG: hypothetical protein QOE03_3012 [Micromonosporaceae bacterium]|nr:hypothetical protein [Micromonosporaceae bacterium]